MWFAELKSMINLLAGHPAVGYEPLPKHGMHDRYAVADKTKIFVIRINCRSLSGNWLSNKQL